MGKVDMADGQVGEVELQKWGGKSGLQLTLIMAPESLILGFLGVEVFELSKVPDPVPQ